MMRRDLPGSAVFAVFAAAVAAIGGLLMSQSFAPLVLVGCIAAPLLVVTVLGVKAHLVDVTDGPALGLGLLRVATGVALAGLSAYQLLFNYLPEGRRLELAGIVALSLSALSVTLLLSARRGNGLGPVVFTLAFLCACLIMGTILGRHSLAITTTFRASYPLLPAAAFVLYPKAIPLRVVGWLAALTIVGGAGISFAHGRTFVFNEVRLTPFTGGLDGIHSSAYVLALCAITLNELRRQGRMSSAVTLPLIAIAGLGILEFKVATAAVMLLAYFSLRSLMSAKTWRARVLTAALAAALLSFGYQARVQQKLTERYGSRTADATTLSSGRLSAWGARFHIIDSRSAGLFLFGSGVGSDRISLDIWGGAALDSHNDFLTILIEEGALGLIGYLALLGALARIAGREARPVFLALILSSALDTALFARPMVAPLLWLAAGVAASAARPPHPAAEREGLADSLDAYRPEWSLAGR